MTEQRRTATLVSFARQLAVTAQDDSLDVLDMLMRDLLARSANSGKKARLRTLRDLDTTALSLAEISEKVITPEWTDDQVRTFLTEKQAKITEAVATIYELARPADDNYYQEIVARYSSVRRFFPALLLTIEFTSNEAGKPILKALTFLKDLEGQKHPDLIDAPMEVVPASWKRHVAPTGKPVDRRYYTLCVLERLHEALRRHDVFVNESTRWGDPRAKLLAGEQWERVRPTICQSLGRKAEPKMELDELALDDLPTSICAVLLAEACNVGLTPMVRKGIPALERDRLLYVQHNYIRPDTLSRANARLVDYQAHIPLAQAWGGGEVTNADGLRFVLVSRNSSYSS